MLALHAWLKACAAKVGAVYADYFTALADEKGMLRDGLSADGLHPNTKGYELMAPVVDVAIGKALGRQSSIRLIGVPRPPTADNCWCVPT